jgi:hypothetical protein
VIEVTAEQFAWNVHYPGPDGVFGKTDLSLLDVETNPLGLDRKDPAAKDDITTLNQLYLPANKPVIVKLRSKDVIHSFNLPEFRVKQDAVPGHVAKADVGERTNEHRIGRPQPVFRDLLHAPERSDERPFRAAAERARVRRVYEVHDDARLDVALGRREAPSFERNLQPCRELGKGTLRRADEREAARLRRHGQRRRPGLPARRHHERP